MCELVYTSENISDKTIRFEIDSCVTHVTALQTFRCGVVGTVVTGPEKQRDLKKAFSFLDKLCIK